MYSVVRVLLRQISSIAPSGLKLSVACIIIVAIGCGRIDEPDVEAAADAKILDVDVLQIPDLAKRFLIQKSGIDQAKAINAWIFESISADGKPRVDGSVEETLRLMDGQCTLRADLAAALAANTMDARRVSFFGVPYQVGHSAVELFVDGKWLFFDPTFGLYFAAPGSPDIPLSIAEARRQFPNVVAMQAVTEGWQGKPSPSMRWRYDEINIGDVAHPSNSHVLVADMPATYFGSEMYVEGEASTYVGTLFIDLATHDKGEIGKIDESYDDLLSPYHIVSGYEQYAPFMFSLGETPSKISPKSAMKFQFTAQEREQVELVVNFVNSPSKDEQSLFLVEYKSAVPMYGDLLYEPLDWSDRAVRVIFHVEPPFAELTVRLTDSAGDKGFLLDNLTWSAAELSEL